jgi:hypothetical protein
MMRLAKASPGAFSFQIHLPEGRVWAKPPVNARVSHQHEFYVYRKSSAGALCLFGCILAVNVDNSCMAVLLG